MFTIKTRGVHTKSSPYVLPTASVRQQPTASTSHSHPAPTAHNTAQVIIPVQVQSQFQPTATFPPMAAMLQRGHLNSMLASIEQPLHLFSSSPSSDHRPIATSATLQKLTREVAANAIPTRKKKTTEDVFETRIANARLAYGGSVGWCRLYRSVPFGMLPTKEQLKTHNPPSAMKLLTDVPIDNTSTTSTAATTATATTITATITTTTITTTTTTMTMIKHKAFEKLISYANSNLTVQNSDTLWRLLEKKTVDTRAKLVEELHRHCPNGSLTADSWTSDDGRKFQAVTYHYVSPEFEMGKVLVGMDEIQEPQQKAEVLLASLGKSGVFM
ncbi:hypothetical protein BKA57DRAFT_197640 [Linnemannia elongata]|nr:hypothetical protein BKA57DRAFT_197640 [Linnemannia elongata]